MIANEGSIVNALKLLHLTPQTVSGQLSIFENYLGVQLFDHNGKRLVLNETGKLAFGFARDIFSLSHELQHVLNSQQLGQQVIFSIDVTDVIPKVFSIFLGSTAHQQDHPQYEEYTMVFLPLVDSTVNFDTGFIFRLPKLQVGYQ